MFLEPNSTWSKQPAQNRGLTNDGEEVARANRRTGAQKSIILDRMLGFIAQFAPLLLRSDIIKRSTS